MASVLYLRLVNDVALINSCTVLRGEGERCPRCRSVSICVVGMPCGAAETSSAVELFELRIWRFSSLSERWG